MPNEGKTPNYLLGDDRESSHRYELFNDIYQPGTVELLSRFDIHPDMTVLEVGCGIGVTTCYFAEHVVPDGHVVAFDQAADLIEVAKRRVADRNLGNVTFICDTAQAISLEPNRFDLAHSRYVLTYIPDAGRIVKKLFNALKPGGLFLGEEVAQLYVKRADYPWYDSLARWFAELVACGKGKPSYGLDSLPGDMLAAGFEELKVGAYWPLEDPAKNLAMLRLTLSKEMAGVLVNNGIATRGEIDEVMKAFENTGPHTVLSPAAAIQVTGRKPATGSPAA